MDDHAFEHRPDDSLPCKREPLDVRLSLHVTHASFTQLAHGESEIEPNHLHRSEEIQVVREEVASMKLRTFARLASVLLLVGAVAVSASGCVFIPYPVGGGGGHHHHDRY